MSDESAPEVSPARHPTAVASLTTPCTLDVLRAWVNGVNFARAGGLDDAASQITTTATSISVA